MNQRSSSHMMYVKSKAPYYLSDDLEIILVLKGQVKVTKIERAFVLNEKEFTLVNRHIVHYLESDEGAYILITKIRLEKFNHIFDKMAYVEFLNTNEIYDIERPLKNQMNAIIVDSLVKLYQYEVGQEKEFEENQLMYTLFLNYQLITHIKEIEEYPTTELMNRYYQVVEYIMQNIHSKIMTEDIINLVYMNPTYFSQFMKRVGGVGFKEFVFYRKLIMICKYLLTPELTMSETALKVGITDMKSFYSNFKKYFHISPSKWRQHIQEVQDDYVMIEDHTILNDFIEIHNIHRHRENTVTKMLKHLLLCQEQKMDLNEVTIKLNPYLDMGDTYDPDYQVYKNIGALTKVIFELNARVLLEFPMCYLNTPLYQEVFLSALREHSLLFGLAALKKNRVILIANNLEELEIGRTLQRAIDKKLGNIDVLLTYQSK